MKIYVFSLALLASAVGFAQRSPQSPNPGTPGATPPASMSGMGGFGGAAAPKVAPKPYKDVITDKAVTKKGLFTVHKVDDKFYF